MSLAFPCLLLRMMSDVFWLRLTDICSSIGFIASVFGNSTLLILLCGKFVNGIGTYRYLMIAFCIFSFVFSLLEKFMRPLMHHHENALFVLQRKRWDFSDSTARIISASYCGCFAMCFVMFAVHFIYRYYVFCHPEKLLYFRGWNFLCWIIGMLLVALSWVVFAYVFFEVDEETERDLNFIISTCYGLNRRDVGYVPYAFYQNNGEQLRIKTLIGVTHHLLVMQVSITTVFSYGIKTYQKLIKVQGKSQRTRQLQHQFFVALVVQTLIPLVFMFIPNMIFTGAAFFGGSLGSWANLTVVMNHLYPAVDSFVIMFIIKGFRDTIKDFIFCRKPPKQTVNGVSQAGGRQERRSVSNVIF